VLVELTYRVLGTLDPPLVDLVPVLVAAQAAAAQEPIPA
jgi:hypothetical protein